MDFYINKKTFGTDFHILFQNGESKRVLEIPENIIDVSSDEMRLISKIYKFDLPRFPPKKYKNSFYGLVEKKTEIPWIDIIPKDEFLSAVKKYIKELKELLLDLDLTYYNECYKKQNIVFDNLKPARINQKTYWDFAKNNPSVRTFLPIKGYSKPIIYDRFSSTTGRLIVEKGPLILTVKKEIRNNILNSRFGDNGSIYSFDYSSLEPRVLLSFMGKKNLPKDLYAKICEETGVSVPRQAIKTAILSRLYGAQDSTIKEQLKHLVSYPESVIQMVDDYFDIESAKEKVCLEYFKNETNTLYNFYKRPIKFENIEPYKLLNYFIQSTAVDVALFGFADIIKRIKMAEIDTGIIPLFILHDALILDIEKKYSTLIPKMLSAGSKKIPGFKDIVFHMEEEKLV